MKKQNSINGSIIIFLVFTFITIFHQFYYADTTINPTDGTTASGSQPSAAAPVSDGLAPVAFESTPPNSAPAGQQAAPSSFESPSSAPTSTPSMAPTVTPASTNTAMPVPQQPVNPTPAPTQPVQMPTNSAKVAMNEFTVISIISTAFDKLKNQSVYSIKDAEVAEFFRSHIEEYVYNKNFTVAKKKIKATLEKLTNKSTESLDTIDITLLDKSKLLITVPYYLASYQTSNLFITYDGKDIKFTANPFEPEDGAEYAEYNFSNTAPAIVTENSIIQVVSKSRGAGDCGIISIYKFINDFFKIINQREITCSK